MILRAKPTLWDVLFTLKGSIAKRIAVKMIAMTLFAVAVSALAMRHPEVFSQLSATPFTLVGLSLSIFMSFRNNACYDRWWEGRKQWGQLVVDIRCLARETAVFASDPARETILRALCGYTHALAARLRGEDERAASNQWMAVSAIAPSAPNVPDAILGIVGAECSKLVERGIVSEWRYTLLEARLVSLSGVQAACERINTTPLPFAYTLLLHRTAYLFCLLLPFGLAGLLGWATPLLTAIVSYTFFGLDALGDELEEPFGLDANDLPLTALVRTVERDLLAALGETNLPASLLPVDYLLQ
ncbi:bestrophin family protein [Beijerinckia sp. L45]|uniref:bestrophin family protein n=1 Tax=Beijerinckia sp. L45 TaxID=1641855 RepID=UPI00131AFAF9|nr:bestrophin family protein [Beijerinckia sp. L45]